MKYFNQTPSVNWVTNPKELFGWQVIGWNIDPQKAPSYSQLFGNDKLYLGVTTYGIAPASVVSIQAQNTFDKPVQAWDWGINGYNTTLHVSVDLSVPYAGGNTVNAVTLYVEMVNQKNGHGMWVQAAPYSNLHIPDDTFYFDPFTKEAASSFELENTHHTPFAQTERFSLDISRQQLWDHIADMNRVLGTNETNEPGWWAVRHVGVNPEIGNADVTHQGWIVATVEHLTMWSA